MCNRREMSNAEGMRRSSLELLRIIAMFMIVAGHSVVHGGGATTMPLTTNGLFAVGLTQGSRISVDLFVFISGYFSVGKDISAKKLLLLYVQVWTYSVLIASVLFLSGNLSVGVK